MKIKMITKSPVLSSSGESTAHIDADVKYCQYGFPYIQAKTFKGLLRESCIEVCEMYEKNNGYEYSIVDELFGKSGNVSGGVLSFNDLRICGYQEIYSELENNNKLEPNFVKEYYTTIRHNN